MLKIPLDKCRCLWYNTIMLNERKVMINENQNQNENDNQVDERVNVPVNELFGMSVDEWNASQSAWDVLHDQHGLRGLEGRF